MVTGEIEALTAEIIEATRDRRWADASSATQSLQRQAGQLPLQQLRHCDEALRTALNAIRDARAIATAAQTEARAELNTISRGRKAVAAYR